jgi:plastocyanin
MRRTILTGLAVATLAIAGCGGDDEGGSASGGGGGGGGQTLQLAAPENGDLVFEPDTLDAKAGSVTIEFDNPSSVPHAVEVEGNGVEEESDEVTGANTSLSVDLEAGEYTFYCPVDGHRAAGMEGKLTVE